MLAVFAEFERDMLRDRVKAGIEQARMGNRMGQQAGNRQAPRVQSHLRYPLARPSEVLLAP